jgi:hypothetical protein
VEDDNRSNPASTLFNTDELRSWFRNLFKPTAFEFIHSNDNDPHASKEFHDYIHMIENLDFKVWDVQNMEEANTRFMFICSSTGRQITISGRPDFLICEGNSALNDYLFKTRCIVKLQSNDDDEDRCELQLMLYLYLFMNRYGLNQVIGFLVYDDFW